MAQVNLGRVQGGGFFYSSATSGTSIVKSTLSPSGLVPLVGDSVVFPNGDVRKVTSVSGDTVTCGSVLTSFKGPQGATGAAGANGTSSSIVKTGAEWESQDPVLGSGVFGYDSTNDILKVGDGSSAWSERYPLTMSLPAPPSFEAATWAEIAQICADGRAAEVFAVGDEKDIELSTGEVITLVILDFDHDDLADGSGKAPMTIGMKHLLATTYQMNSSNTNSGGWNGSKMRTSTMATLFGQLPADCQAVIKQVNKKASAGSQSTSITTSVDKLFLLAMSEVFAGVSISGSDSTWISDDATTYNKEGTQYKYYENLIGNNGGGTDTNAALIKGLSNGSGSASGWWLRSPYVSHSGNFCYISSSGGVSHLIAYNSYGVAFGFCI